MKYINLIVVFILLFFVMGCSKKEEQTISTQYISSNDFLSANKYKTLIVEVNYMQGFKPTQGALDRLTALLSERLNKPEGIRIITNAVVAHGKTVYSSSDIQNLESIYRKHYPVGNILTAHILFLDGGYTEDNGSSKVLGIAYNSTSMAIFEKSINEFSGGITQPSKEVLEATVINHEFGHTLGLVNNGTLMQSNHQDLNHGHHCDNQNCLMYYTAETSDIIGNLIGGNIPEFDQNCLNDLQSNGGK
jgi:predicted Zn-dependent protease